MKVTAGDNSKTKNTLEEWKMETEDYGRVEFEGKEYTLSQQPYIDGGTNGFHRPYYTATAIDQEGNDVRVKWAIKEVYFNEDGNLRDAQDDEMMEYVEEADMCDWDAPVEVYEI